MALPEIKQVIGRGVYIPGDDIDTDQIVPARFLVSVTFDGLGQALFFDARFQRDGSPKPHALNDPRFSGATIALAGQNFGCGSSREAAPQAFAKAGFKAIIAESYAEIFFGNSTTLGIPCVTLNRAEIEGLARAIEQNPALEITVDVEHLEVRAEAMVFKCQLKPSAHSALIAGQWDPISQLLEAKAQTQAVKERLPYTSW